MPVLRKGIAKYFLASIAIFLSLLLVSVFLFSKIYLAKKVQSLIVDIAREKGYEVKVGGIAFGFSGGLEAKDVEIYDSTDVNAPPIKIGEFIVKPDVTSSIIKGKLEIDEILINGADLSFSKAMFQKFKKLSAEIAQQRSGEAKPKFFSIAVKRLEINMGEIDVSPGAKLYLRKLDLDLSDYESNGRGNIGLKGTLLFLDNEIGVDGLVNTSSEETNGKLRLNIPEFRTGLSNVLENKGNPSLHADLNFRIGEKITSGGKIELEYGEGLARARPPASTEVLFGITYDKISDTLFINKFDFEAGNFLLARFGGSVDRITTEGVLNIDGSASTARIQDVITFFRGFSHIVASGKIEAKDLELTGSIAKHDVTFRGKAVLSGVSFDDSERDIRIKGLGGTLDFRKGVSQGVASGLSLQGSLNSEELATKIGLLDDINADLEFKTNRRWSSSRLSFSLYDLKLKTVLSDTIRISDLKTAEPILISFNDTSDESSSGNEGESRRNNISVVSRGLTFKDASYKDFRIKSGSLDDILVLYQANQNLSLQLTIYGSQIRNMDDRMYLDRIQVNLASDENGGSGFNGKVDLKDGRYGGLKFPFVTSDYRFKNGEIKLTKLEAGLEGLGDLKAKETRIIFGGKGGRFSSKIEFSQASFSGTQYGIGSKGIRGEFIFHNGRNRKTNWGGNAFVDEVSIKSQSVKKISLKIDSSSDGIRVHDLQGRVLGGRVGGSLLLNITRPDSSISSYFIVEDANIPYKSNVFLLARMIFDFRGTIGKGLTPQGNGEVRIENLRIEDNGKASTIRGDFKFQTIDETLQLTEGLITNGDEQKIEFTGRIQNLLNEQRVLKINSDRIPLSVVKNILNPLLPESFRGGNLRGDAKLDMVFDHVLNKKVSWSGKLSLANASFAGVVSQIPIYVNGVNGVIKLDEYSEAANLLASLLREHHKFDREVFKRFLSLLSETDSYRKKDFLRIDEIKYGFLGIDHIECLLNMTGLKLNIDQCASNLFDGRAYVAGSFDYRSKKDRYNLSVLFKDISLEDISNRVNSIKDYITGRINGLVWLNGNGEELKTMDGLFEFWSIKSKKESRRLGKAFLEKLGAKSRFFIGSSRSYDRAEISGYIKEGVLTFSKFNISNTILGYKNLSIKVDPRRNTISLAHMISVIREISKRASEGQLQIDLRNKRN
jgi:hypothetical protein